MHDPHSLDGVLRAACLQEPLLLAIVIAQQQPLRAPLQHAPPQQQQRR
jgi:hypothetical protein